MPALTACALVGVLAGLWIPVFAGEGPWPVVLILAATFAWWFAGFKALAAIIAFAFTSLHCHWYLAGQLTEGLVKQDVLVEGVIADFPRLSEGQSSFVFEAAGGAFPARMLLRVYADTPSPRPGERWQLLVRLKRPLSTVNPGVFDRETWLLWNRIYATGYVRSSLLNRRLDAAGNNFSVLKLRADIRLTIEQALADSPVRPLIIGITIGARDAINSDTWRILRDTGTAHLMAISGLHIGLMAIFAWYPGFITGWLLYRCNILPNPLFLARVFALTGVGAYGILAGGSVPTLRASLMVSVVVLLGAVQRRRSVSGVLAFALLAVLVVDPFVVLSGGFWLSFTAVALLSMCILKPYDGSPAVVDWRARTVNAIKAAVQRGAKAQTMLVVGLALPVLALFAQFSTIGWFANLVVVPAFSCLALPPILAGVALTLLDFSVGKLLLAAGAIVLEWILIFLTQLAQLPGATWQPGYIGWISMILASVGLVFVLLPRPIPGRLIGVMLLLLAVSRDKPDDGFPLKLRVLDVGQGLAVLVETSHHSLLYDTGASWRGGDAGQSVIVPMLNAAGVTGLDMMVISHDDSDHSGGARSILAALPVSRVIGPANNYLGLRNSYKCVSGISWEWDGVSFTIIHPGKEDLWSDNNSSCVLLIQNDNTAVLLPGDIEAEAEREMVNSLRLPNIDVVLGPHHGSKTSSDKDFVDRLKASYVIFSTGYANRWGFPAEEVIRRWNKSNTCVLNTASSGALEFVASAEGKLSLVAAQRSRFSRPWPLRMQDSGECVGTINSAGSGL